MWASSLWPLLSDSLRVDGSLGRSGNWVEGLFVISSVTDQQTTGCGDDRIGKMKQAVETICRLRAAIPRGERISASASLQPGQAPGQ